MGHPNNLRSIPRDCKYECTAERSVSPCIRQGTKLRDMLMSDKPKLSYAHFHHEITRGPGDTLPKSSHHSQGLDRMTLKEDEVVRYMSNLPSYLEKGKNFQEKALSVGVIDWKRLEKWQNSQKQMPRKYTGYSPSSSNTSFSSTDGSSSRSSQSPARLTMPSLSLQSPLDAKSSVIRGKCEEIGIFGGSTRMSMKSEENRTANTLRRQQKVFEAFEDGEKKGTELKSSSGMLSRPNLEVPSKGKIKLQGNEPAKEAPSFVKSNAVYRDHFEKEKSGFSIKSKDNLVPSRNDNKHLESTGYHTKISSQGVNAPLSQASYLLPLPARRFNSPSRSRNTDEMKPIAGLRVVSAAGKSMEENSSESIPKARHPSPIRRLSFAVSNMIKNVGSRESSPLRRSCSTDGVAKSLPRGPKASASADIHSAERSSSNSRGRSSPLRRLFDPLLKPKGSSSPEPSKKHSSSTLVAMKIKPRCSTHDADPNLNIGSSSLQALLQVSFKNGLPLFTFATDNESNILAATVRKSYVPGKAHYTWTYTFFTVREIKRKSGIWLNNQGGKGVDGHGYVPNVVAQMKVSDSHADNNDTNREFDLFAVDIGHGDQTTTDFHPTNELAAIAVKLPGSNSGNPCKDGNSAYSWLDLSHAFSRDELPEMKYSIQSPNCGSTVILPGGVHTIPSKGEISTLAQRWRSGGSCDCGGWDLGCQLRVYTNQIGYERTMEDGHKFQLFSQVGQVMLSLAPFKERIYSVEFSSSLSLLQAFAICISYIDSSRPTELSGPPSTTVEKMSYNIRV